LSATSYKSKSTSYKLPASSQLHAASRKITATSCQPQGVSYKLPRGYVILKLLNYLQEDLPRKVQILPASRLITISLKDTVIPLGGNFHFAFPVKISGKALAQNCKFSSISVD
jgi:hypothetical protein